jgi:hypothetical protein
MILINIYKKILPASPREEKETTPNKLYHRRLRHASFIILRKERN